MTFGVAGVTRDAYGPGSPPLGTLQRVLSGGRLAERADLIAYEVANNVDGRGPESNPNNVLALGRHQIVVDSAANAVYDVDPSGDVSVIAVLPRRSVTAPHGPVSVDDVPTDVARGPDRALYISDLTGNPYPRGAARVYRLVPGHAPTVFANDLTMATGLAFDRRGRLYVLQYATSMCRDRSMAR